MYNYYKLTLKANDKSSYDSDQLKAESFNLDKEGLFLYNTSNWHLTTEDAKMLGLSISGDKLDIQGKTIYRYPKLALPRQKVDLLKGSYDVKVSRNPATADIHIVSTKFIESLVKYNWDPAFSKRRIYEMFIEMREKDLLSEGLMVEIRKMLEDTHNSDMFSISIPYSYSDGFQGTYPNYVTDVNDIITKTKKTALHQRCGIISDPAKIKLFNQLTTTTASIVLDEEVSKKIDESLVTLTEEDYDNLCTQIKSDNIDDRSVALEMMANCNLEASFDIVTMIYYFYFEYCKSTTNWNTVNVKGLKNRLSSIAGGCQKSQGYTYNRLVQFLVKQGKLTPFVIRKCKEMIHSRVLKASALGDIWKIDMESIYLNEDLQKHIIEKDA